MPMIQGIDGGLLINALRQGREDRYQDDARRMKAEQEKAEAERQRGVMGALSRIGGGAQPSGGGVMGQTVGRAPTAPAGPTASMAGDFMPSLDTGTQRAVDQIAAMPSAPAPAQRGGINQDALGELLVLDPETFGKVVTGLKTKSEMEIKQLQTRNDAMASAAMYLRRIPAAQRAQAFQQIAPQLAQAGWSQEELAQADLDDMALAGYQAIGMDFEKAVQADLKEREFRAGKTVPVNSDQGVAQIVPVMGADGQFIGNRASMIVQPYGQSAPAAQQPPAEAIAELRANPGTAVQFDEIFGPGASARILGGGASNGTGGFPRQ